MKADPYFSTGFGAAYGFPIVSPISETRLNYLAHAYLSFQQPGLVVGNMISDFVKGKAQYTYPEPVYRGIRLHRAIDTFTDEHEATRQAKSYFRPAYRLYAGPLVDVVFDHFLAVDPQYFSTGQELADFSGTIYQTLQQHDTILPDRFRQMLPYMQQQDWLLNYRYPEGIRQSLGGLVRRSTYLEDAATAFRLWQAHYDALQACFSSLFPELQQMARQFIAASA